jgi:hypothetical protein
MYEFRTSVSASGLGTPNLQGAFRNLQTIVEGVGLCALWQGLQIH